MRCCEQPLPPGAKKVSLHCDTVGQVNLYPWYQISDGAMSLLDSDQRPFFLEDQIVALAVDEDLIAVDEFAGQEFK